MNQPLDTILTALPTVLVGVAALGVLLLVRAHLAEVRRRRRFAATVRQLHEVKEPIFTVVTTHLPASHRLGAHLGAVVEELERVVTLLDEENLDDAAHELRLALVYAKGVQAEYGPKPVVTALRRLA